MKPHELFSQEMFAEVSSLRSDMPASEQAYYIANDLIEKRMKCGDRGGHSLVWNEFLAENMCRKCGDKLLILATKEGG